MKKSYLIIVFCLVLVGCKKESPPEFDLGSLYPELIGEWTWNRTIFLSEPYPEIPELTDSSLNFSMSIKENGTVEHFQDGFLINSTFIKDLNEEFNRLENGTWVTFVYFNVHPFSGNNTYNHSNLLLFQIYSNYDEIGILEIPFTTYDHPIYGATSTRNLYNRK